MAQQGAAVVTRIGPRVAVMPAREVPLGGLRSMNVQRALPQRALPTVGAWCFLDRFGPQRTTMRVEPHPHMGLQTVTWPLTGEVRHRDSIGSDALLSAGQLNLMTSGAGIAHSEYSIGEAAIELDALQLWIALPDNARWNARGFERHEALPTVTLTASVGDDAEATVIMGSLAGVASPATTYSPLVGAQLRIAAGSRVRVPLDAAWEHAVVLLDGDVELPAANDGHPANGDLADGELANGDLADGDPADGDPADGDPADGDPADGDPANGDPADGDPANGDPANGDPAGRGVVRPRRNDLVYLGTKRDHIEVSSEHGALVFLLGGEPFEEELVMWWNFVGRSHEEVVEARDAWEAQSERFGSVGGHGDLRVPAPPMPSVRLTPRSRRI